MAQAETVAEICGGEHGRLVCNWVYERSSSEFWAEAAAWAIDRPLRILIILGLGLAASRLLGRSVRRFGQQALARGERALGGGARARQRATTLSSVLTSLATGAVWVVVGLLVLGQIGITLGPLLAGAGVVGVVLAFGAQRVVADFLAGTFMLTEDQFGVGDVVDLGEVSGTPVSGTVEAVSLRVTTLRDVHGTVWYVPNSEIRRVGNKSQLWSRAVLDIEVAYNTDLRQAQALIAEVAEGLWQDETFTGGDIIERPEVLGIERVGVDGVTIRLVVKTDPSDQWAVARELRLRLKEALDAATIESPVPQRTIWVRQAGEAAHDATAATSGVSLSPIDDGLTSTRSRLGALLLVVALVLVACTSSADSTDDTAPPVSIGGTEIATDASGAPMPDATPLPVDPAIRTGTLDNGLTYYVRSNATPGGSVTLRLAVKAGGVNEDPRGAGLAHFLEHMLFNGTERFPGNELDATLRRLGAEIGPDFNAYTSDSETVYQLSVNDVDDNVEVAFDVLAQWASAATLDPVEVAAEAGVVREEERSSRESGEGLVEAAFERAYFSGTPWQGVDVIGTPETIDAITPDRLRAFYDTWYRPDNMAVVAVGDRPVEELEQTIVDRFAALEARAPAVRFELGPTPPRTAPLVDVVVEPGYGRAFVSLDHPLPDWDLGTGDGNELAYLDDLGGAMLNERLNDGIGTGRLDLDSAFAGPFWQNRSLHYQGFNVDGADLVAATQALTTEIARSVAGGFTQDELDRALQVYRQGEDQRLAEAGSIQDVDRADTMVDHFIEGADLQDTEASVAMGHAILDGVTLARLNTYWRWAMTAQEPILLVVGPDAGTVGRVEDHRAALERAATAAELEAVTDDVVPIEALMAPPAPVPAGRFALVHNDGFELRFANGARVLFSPADFAAAQVSVETRSPGGLAQLPAEDRAVAATAVDVVAASGLAGSDPVQVRRYLRDTDVILAPYLDPSGEGFYGSSSADDLETLFQVLHLWVTAPRADTVPFDQQVQRTADYTLQAGLEPTIAADAALYDSRYSRLGLVSLPTDTQLAALTPARAEDIFRSRFANLDDHVVAVVGDVDPERVVELARRYIGTLPGSAQPGGAAEPETVVEAEPEVVRRLDVGTGQAAGAYRLNLTGMAEESTVHQVLADLAESLLNDRLFTVVREQLGATYGGSAGLSFDEPGDLADVTVSVDGDPARLDEIAVAVDTEITALAQGRVSGPDFAEAKAVVENRYSYTDHQQILSKLLTEAADPARSIDDDRLFDVLDNATPGQLAAFMAELTTGAARTTVYALPGG